MSVLELYCLHVEALDMFLKHEKKMSIGIIGSGMSGLGSNRFLKRAGFQNLTILEARNRIGGRVNSITAADGSNIDLGASWIHGLGPGANDEEKW